MIQYIALFRGINVGGKNILPMKELAELLTKLGFNHVQTYIQSGNAVFCSDLQNKSLIAEMIGTAINDKFEFQPAIMIVSADELKEAVKNNPFKDTESEPKTLHIGFLSEIPDAPDLDKMEEIRKETEHFQLFGSLFYLHAPEGVGRSKLASKSEKLIGVPMTMRNWATVTKLLNIAQET